MPLLEVREADNLKEDLTSKSGMGMLQAEHEEFLKEMISSSVR